MNGTRTQRPRCGGRALPDVTLILDAGALASAQEGALQDLTGWAETFRLDLVLAGDRSVFLNHESCAFSCKLH